ncbi:unnamed protein product [Parnassius mnemosyne]
MVYVEGLTANTVNRIESCGSKQASYVDSEVEDVGPCSVCGAGAGEADSGGSGGGAGLWREVAAEVCGTALLVLLTCLSSCAAEPPLHTALAAGLVVATLVQCLDHISGAMINPTVTLAAVVAGRLSGARGALYALAQAGGAAAGGALLRALAPRAAACCRTCPAPHVSLAQAVCVEAALGAVLALCNCAAWDARNRRLLDSWPLRVGLTVTALSLAAGELTGASMNPVRSLAPALYSGDWTAQWVYCVGPPLGALCATALYRCVWCAPPAAIPRGSAILRATPAHTHRP